MAATHDLRRKAQRITDLRRRYNAHEKLSDEDMAELNRGMPDEEMAKIIDDIRGERRNALPAKKVREKKEEQDRREMISKPINLDDFIGEEQ